MLDGECWRIVEDGRDDALLARDELDGIVHVPEGLEYGAPALKGLYNALLAPRVISPV